MPVLPWKSAHAALVEQSAAAAESLKAQAQQLVQAVAVFKVSHGGNYGASAAMSIAPVKRGGPNRAANVARPELGTKMAPAAPAQAHAAVAPPQKSGTDGWESF